MINRTPDFDFGQNWSDFLSGLDEDRVASAGKSLTDFLKIKDFRGKSFLDIGSGSGLFSLAAFRLGAEKVVSFDLNPLSVECARQLRESAGSPPNWEVCEGSILDNAFVSKLEQFDIVYSWGVLHHTGRMWDAVVNAAGLVKPGGNFYIALYNKILTRNGNSSPIHDFWVFVKKTHNSRPIIGKYLLEPAAMSAYILMIVAQGKNPVSHIRNYKSDRGMSWRIDAVDWLGGWPYEFASIEEVFTFMRSRYPLYELRNLRMTGGRGLNWYLFENTGPSES
jgi:2-polyprenyl-6-hydroxyphenyl methylase/3-demethylubiquinone-9 3-methyltransferase